MQNGSEGNVIYAVNERIWRFIMKLYGGGPEIPQIVRSFSIKSESDKFSDARTMDTMNRSDHYDSTRGSFGFDSSFSYKNAIAKSKPCGMNNERFYCYMNACIQCLLSFDSLVQYVSQKKYQKALNTKTSKFWWALSEIVDFNNSKINPFTPTILRRIAEKFFHPHEQHDSHEFLRYFLSGLQDEINIQSNKKEIEFKDPESAWNYYKKHNVSLIDDLFAGQLISKVRCGNCGHVSTTYDPFLDLSVPVIPDKTKNFDDCLTAFLKEEEIKDSYTCEKCKSNSRVIKKLSINKFPQILVVHFKRFQTFPVKKKIKDFIEFPIETMRIKK